MHTVKCVVVGDGTVGKTCLLTTFTTNNFPEHVPPIFEGFSVDVLLANEQVKLSLWDTMGGGEFDRLRPLAYPQTDVFLLCYSIADACSFASVAKKWQPELQHYCPAAPIILVGTKLDLRFAPTVIATLANRGVLPISYKQGFQLAREIGAVHYLECSSLTTEGLRVVFEEAASSVHNRRKARCNVL